MALIERSGDYWRAVVHLHDGVQEHAPAIKRATWATLDGALNYICAVAEEYPNTKDLPIIIDDL